MPWLLCTRCNWNTNFFGHINIIELKQKRIVVLSPNIGRPDVGPVQERFTITVGHTRRTTSSCVTVWENVEATGIFLPETRDMSPGGSI